jgi:hypothetical protein
MTTNTDQALVTRLMGGARGDLALDGNGDLRYGIKTHEDGRQTREPCGPKFAKLHYVSAIDSYRWELTPAGAEFMLENIGDGYTRPQMRFLEALCQRQTSLA